MAPVAATLSGRMELFDLDAPAWAMAIAAVVIGAMLQGSLGFGLGLVSAPILVLIDPTLVPAVVIGMSVPLSMAMASREWRALDMKPIKWAIIARFPGAFVGGIAVALLDTRGLALLFGAAILSAVAISVAGVSVRRTPTTMSIAGFVSGVSGTTTSVGGPPMAIVLQDLTGPQLRASMSTYMVIGSITSLLILTLIGELGGRELGMIGILLPAAFTGFVVSSRTNKALDRGYTRPAVLTVAAISAIAVLIRNL